MSSTDSQPKTIIPVEQLPSINAEQAKAIFAQGEAAVVFALLELAKQLAESRSPSVNPATPPKRFVYIP